MLQDEETGGALNERLLADLSARYRDVFRRYFNRSVGNHAEAEDLTQELFIRIIRKTDFATVKDAEPFLFKIAINLLRDRSRRKRTSNAFLSEISTASAQNFEALSPERVLQSKQSLQMVMATLNDLDPKSKHMFVLNRLDGMKYAEIAALYGISVSAVEKHIVKCLAHLGQASAARWK